MTIVRAAAPTDEAAWRRLWAGYLTFYEASVPDRITALTWQRILDPTVPMLGRLAERDDQVAGFALAVLHPGTWVDGQICYLEDLFVDPAVRGEGIGGQLIADLVEQGRMRGWSRIYWHTRSDNPARVLYDRFTEVDDVVRYQMSIG